jgi:hypothetical protein
MTKTILGIFTNKSDVEAAITKLREDGFPVEDISLIMKDRNEAGQLNESTQTTIAEGTASGTATGAILGGLAGLASAVIPGIGALFIGGPIATALGLTGAAAATASGAVTGAIAGGILGALTSIGLPREEAVYYEDQIRHGAILLAVPVRSLRQEGYVSNIFDEYNASDVRTIAPDTSESGEDDVDYEDYSYPERGREGAYFTPLGAKGGRTKRKKPVA